ncbi:MAG: hypothetical protein AAFQ65_01535 [Myxococcota bacterium]
MALPLVFGSASSQSGTSLETVPSGAAVFSKDRGSLFFEGFTPLLLNSVDQDVKRFVLFKPGYVKSTATRSPQTISLQPKEGFTNLTANCRKPDFGFTGLNSRLEIVGPVVDAGGANGAVLFVTARVLGRKLQSQLRGIRRNDGLRAYHKSLRDLAAPVADYLYVQPASFRCYREIVVRLVYSSKSISMQWKREQAVVSQSQTYSSGAYAVTVTNFGVVKVTSPSIVMDPDNKKYVDIVFSKSKSRGN